MIEKFKSGQICEGVCEAVLTAGQQLKVFFPYQADDSTNCRTISHLKINMKRSVLIFFICITSFLQAQDLPEPMRPKRIVNDFTQLFSPQQQQALEQKLRNFNDTSSTQIAIVTVPTLQGYAPSDYAQRLAEKWGVGQKGKDNGVLLLIKPKSRTEKGQVAIAVGYGLEGVIPDAIASRIIRNEIIPEFQQNNYYRGINKATDVLMQLAGGEFTAEQYARKNGNGSAEGSSFLS